MPFRNEFSRDSRYTRAVPKNRSLVPRSRAQPPASTALGCQLDRLRDSTQTRPQAADSWRWRLRGPRRDHPVQETAQSPNRQSVRSDPRLEWWFAVRTKAPWFRGAAVWPLHESGTNPLFSFRAVRLLLFHPRFAPSRPPHAPKSPPVHLGQTDKGAARFVPVPLANWSPPWFALFPAPAAIPRASTIPPNASTARAPSAAGRPPNPPFRWLCALLRNHCAWPACPRGHHNSRPPAARAPGPCCSKASRSSR